MLVGVVLVAVGCGYRVRTRSHFAAAHTPGGERAAWCASNPGACRARCEEGDASTCNLLGVQLELGVSGTQSATAASRLYRLGCDADFAPSCTNLGWLVLRGDGVPADPPVALVLFQRAYDAYARSCVNGSGAGCMSALDTLPLLDATDEEADRVEVALLERACRLGQTRACTELDR